MSQKGFASILIVLVGIIVIAGVAGGAYYLGTQRPSSSPTLQPISQSTPVPTANNAESTTSAETADWKIYTDTTNRFTIKYPNSWLQFTLSDKTGGYLSKIALVPQAPSDKQQLGELPGVRIAVLKLDPKNCTNSAEYAQEEINAYLNNKNLYPNLQIKPLILDGIPGYRIDSGSPGVTAQRGPEVYMFQCPTEIQMSFDPEGIENGIQLFDQILSTFKFLEDKLKVCPDNWFEFFSPIQAVNNPYYGQEGQFMTINESLDLIPAEKFDLEWIRKNCEVNKPEAVG